ncbi:hypothetical protein AAEU41_23365, partial [Pantoea agglomerans]
MSIYKFLPKKYLNEFFKTGSLRLGTVYDFNDTVKHGTAVGDTREGRHGIYRNEPGTIHVTG